MTSRRFGSWPSARPIGPRGGDRRRRPVGTRSRGGGWPPTLAATRSPRAASMFGPAEDVRLPTGPRSSAATIPAARSSTWTAHADVVRPEYGSLPVVAPAGAAAEARVVARAVDLARHDDDDRRARRVRSATSWAPYFVSSYQLRNPRRGRGGTSRRRPPAGVAEHVDRRDVDDPRRLRRRSRRRARVGRADVRVPHRRARRDPIR